jgi:hypothetical protein
VKDDFFCMKVVFKKDDFLLPFFVYNFSSVFSKFKKKIYMKVVFFTKDNFHINFNLLVVGGACGVYCVVVDDVF